MLTTTRTVLLVTNIAHGIACSAKEANAILLQASCLKQLCSTWRQA